MKWYERYHQSYKTAPTRSGKMGSEHGEAAKQAARLESDEKRAERYKKHAIRASRRYSKREAKAYKRMYADALQKADPISAKKKSPFALVNTKNKNSMKQAMKAAAIIQAMNTRARMGDKEIEYIKSMSISDISKERKEAALRSLATIGAAAGTAGLVNALMPTPITAKVASTVGTTIGVGIANSPTRQAHETRLNKLYKQYYNKRYYYP